MIRKIQGKWATREVWLDGKRLSPRASQKVWNHSPDGFNWGYGGSGPAQLALGILLACGVEEQAATDKHQAFKWRFVARLPQGDFEEQFDLEAWLEKTNMEVSR